MSIRPLSLLQHASATGVVMLTLACGAGPSDHEVLAEDEQDPVTLTENDPFAAFSFEATANEAAVSGLRDLKSGTVGFAGTAQARSLPGQAAPTLRITLLAEVDDLGDDEWPDADEEVKLSQSGARIGGDTQQVAPDDLAEGIEVAMDHGVFFSCEADTPCRRRFTLQLERQTDGEGDVELSAWRATARLEYNDADGEPSVPEGAALDVHRLD